MRLAREVMERGGLSGAVFNAAKETALDGFIDGALSFPGMAEVVDATLNTIDPGQIDAPMTLDTVMHADKLARIAAREVIRKEQDRPWTFPF